MKVRGYRIELAEIEAALLRHPKVRSAAVVVRTSGPHDDPRLVAYITLPAAPIDVGRPRLRTATELRRFLGETLPPYMVPAQVVTLASMPLTPSGKIDRAALPDPGDALPATDDARDGEFVAPRTPLERAIAEIWEQELGVRPVGVTDDFFALGATSVAAAHVLVRLERTLGARLPVAPLFRAPTIEALARLMEASHAGARGAAREFASLAPIQPSGSRTPIFCVHGGAGTILHLLPLGHHLGDDQPLYGLQMPGLYGDRPLPPSVAAMARLYVREIRRVQPRGPYVLAGYCFGAIVAHEMARRLTAAGERVALVISLNGPAPAYIRRYGRPRHRTDVGTAAPVPPPRGRLDAALHALKRHWWEARGLGVRGLLSREHGRLVRYGWLLRRHCEALAGRVLPDAARERAIFELTSAAERATRLRPWAGPMLVVQAEGLYHEPGAGWPAVPGARVETVVVRGHHEDQRTALHEPMVAAVAEAVRAAVDRALGDGA